MKAIYGYINSNNKFIETGHSTTGAKTVAIKQGSNEVGYRSPINNMYYNTHYKVNGKWYNA